MSLLKRNKVASAEKVRCFDCEHYYVTWQKKYSHGCRAFGFKSALMPCLAVGSASSESCLQYKKKVFAVD